MFTGIIETTGIIKDIFSSGTNKTFWVQSALAHQLTIDQSVAHNGVCLTVEEVKDGLYRITAIEETLLKTNLTGWKINTVVNIERCMQMNGRIDGHIVQGHVDTVATCIENIAKDGSWEYQFEFDKKFGALIIEKGSIALNGISLTIFNVKENGFTVAIIPYTYHHTNMQYLKQGDKINIEFDMIGKYVGRIMELK
ncbi:riboflavin synthase [Ferruginibacter sp.]|uniref:riboflavin synthase n=1 Tax=Ferruginibacter sp. TaxID=1940288 RepID=UPI0026588D96|nr:riboflavin synthase [Ferruginibacter sp.]